MIVRFAGFGGQGIVLSSYLLGEAAVQDGKKALQNQAYGSESRGGECRGDVIISDEEIHELEPPQQDVLVAMTQPAYESFVPLLRPGGLLIVDQDLVATDEKREPPGIQRHAIRATDIAFQRFGRKIVANMILLGYVNTLVNLVSEKALTDAIPRHVPAGTERMNLEAFRHGIALAQESMKQ